MFWAWWQLVSIPNPLALESEAENLSWWQPTNQPTSPATDLRTSLIWLHSWKNYFCHYRSQIFLLTCSWVSSIWLFKQSISNYKNNCVMELMDSIFRVWHKINEIVFIYVLRPYLQFVVVTYTLSTEPQSIKNRIQ